MYSTFLTASSGSVLFSRSALLKRKDLFVTFVNEITSWLQVDEDEITSWLQVDELVVDKER